MNAITAWGRGAALALALAAPAAAQSQETDWQHHLALQLSEGGAPAMQEVLNIAANVSRFYGSQAEEVQIRIVVFGRGMDMLRADRSPVLERLESFRQSMPNVAFVACQNTIDTLERNEGAPVPVLSMAERVEAGVAELIALDEAGWTIVRP
ncbi:hypothetical protein [Poseidonocella sp. HB161398]|uniref:DsrE family protein n=1 Tax=Poseidonocella sp. HB161398 TaxID=2320855 RepID=UPI001108F1C7|nr:hypothetical protein [Poseidonocella sp. HB161398]